MFKQHRKMRLVDGRRRETRMRRRWGRKPTNERTGNRRRRRRRRSRAGALGSRDARCQRSSIERSSAPRNAVGPTDDERLVSALSLFSFFVPIPFVWL